MKNKYVAIAISVYDSDRPDFLDSSLSSLFSQSYPFIDIYMQVDGYISTELKTVLEKYSNHENFYCDFYPQNMGLAFQLNNAIEKILSTDKYSYIARMDSDDISLPDRIEKQVCYLELNPNIAVVGTSVTEFHSNGQVFEKIMPANHDDLEYNIVKRCPFNHPTVMFNLLVIKDEHLQYNGNLKNTQDYYLWVDLLSLGYKFSNIEDVLLKFRIDDNFHKRRGFKKAVNDFNSRWYAMNKLDILSASNLVHAFLLFGLRISPSFIKEFAYKKLR